MIPEFTSNVKAAGGDADIDQPAVFANCYARV